MSLYFLGADLGFEVRAQVLGRGSWYSYKFTTRSIASKLTVGYLWPPRSSNHLQYLSIGVFYVNTHVVIGRGF